MLAAFYFYQQKRGNQLLKQKQETETSILKLKSIQSQLNPHFIFNSLSSIQSLINSNEINAANEYLSRFSDLMRNTLVQSNNLFQKLDKEINILDTFLKLEQLRFQFSYQITTDGIINKFDTEIPSLLLQPIVENAVKHGVSGLREKGVIQIYFYLGGADMLVEIKDNGPGFRNVSEENGYGLKLTDDRIKLLNNLMKEQEIIKNIYRKDDETVVQLIFKNR